MKHNDPNQCHQCGAFNNNHLPWCPQFGGGRVVHMLDRLG